MAERKSSVTGWLPSIIGGTIAGGLGYGMYRTGKRIKAWENLIKKFEKRRAQHLAKANLIEGTKIPTMRETLVRRALPHVEAGARARLTEELAQRAVPIIQRKFTPEMLKKLMREGTPQERILAWSIRRRLARSKQIAREARGKPKLIARHIARKKISPLVEEASNLQKQLALSMAKRHPGIQKMVGMRLQALQPYLLEETRKAVEPELAGLKSKAVQYRTRAAGIEKSIAGKIQPRLGKITRIHGYMKKFLPFVIGGTILGQLLWD